MDLESLKARMGEILNELEVFNTVEDLSDEQIETVNALSGEFEGIKTKIEAKEKIEAMKAHTVASTRKVAATEPVKTAKVTVTNRTDKTMGFKSFGEFAKAVSNKSKGKIDQRFNNATAYESFADDGGVLIPESFLSEIQEKVQGEESLLSKTSSFQTAGNHLSLPIDEVAPWNGGIQAYWTEEGGLYTESKQVLGQANFRLHKLGAMVKCTDELLDDASALESYIRRKAPGAIVHKINEAIISGDGVGKPNGLIGSSFGINVAAEAGQAAGSVVYQNLLKMSARELPQSAGKTVWLAHPQVKEQLLDLKDGNGNLIYMSGGMFPNMVERSPDMLLGRPIIYMMGGMPALGSIGDIMLVDLDYYYSVVKSSGIKQAISTHLFFDRDITAFKFTMRLDGRCPYTSPVTTQNGAYDMSGIIRIAAR